MAYSETGPAAATHKAVPRAHRRPAVEPSERTPDPPFAAAAEKRTVSRGESYARVVAWGATPDGTAYQSSCTVYEDPATGERRQETTVIVGSGLDRAELMVRSEGIGE
jgi:hypothetical protein